MMQEIMICVSDSSKLGFDGCVREIKSYAKVRFGDALKEIGLDW